MNIGSDFCPIVPMKYGTTPNEEILKNALNSPEFCIQLKRDGVSYALAIDVSGNAHLWGDKYSKKTGRVIDKIDNFEYIKEWAEATLPPKTMILGELYTFYDYTTGKKETRETSKYMNSLCLSKPEKSNQRIAETEKPFFYMFDLLWYDGIDYRDDPFEERDKVLDKCYFQFVTECDEDEDMKWLQKAQTFYDDKATLINQWLEQGHEGGVLKKLSCPHVWAPMGSSAKRPTGYNYKIKHMNTIDVVIKDVLWPNKLYTGKDPENAQYRDEDGNPVNRLWAQGMINSLEIGVYRGKDLITIGTIASGLTDDIRLEIAQHTDEYIGQTIEVAAMSVEPTYSLRHPRFICFRPDKAPESCTWEDVFK